MQSALMGSTMDVRTLQGQNAAQKALHSTPSRRRGPSLQMTRAQQQQTSDQLKLTGPPPQRFAIGPGQFLNVASSAFVALTRLGCGGFVSGYRSGLPKDDGGYGITRIAGRKVDESSATVGSFPRPDKPLELYEFEGCPFCRKVREAICILDLDVQMYPTPAAGPNYRARAVELGGKSRFPFLVDPNTGRSMYESADIIQYLFDTYGDGKVPLGLRLGLLTSLSAGIGMLPRALKGSRYKGGGKLPEKPLVYYGYEMSPFCKIAREALSELEIPHVYRTVARGSPKRQKLFEQRGTFQVPYLEDPNTGVAMFESAYIVDYLNKTYGMPASSL
jgi:glutathione S-transferase